MAADIKELAISYWRMEKWLNNTNVERKMAANSALRTIKRYLDNNKIEVLDLLGQHFDSGLAVDVINNDVPNGTDESKIIISETIKPIIMQEGSVIQFGQVSIGTEVKQTVENKEKNTNNNGESANNQQTNVAEEIIELSKLIKTQNSKKLKIAGIIISILLIAAVGYETFLIFDMNKNIDNSLKAQEELLDSENDKNNVIDSKTIEIKEDKSIESVPDELNKNNDNTIAFVEYNIKTGDSLLSICNEMNISYEGNIEYIKNINGITDINKIYVGQKILLPINKEEN